VIQALDRASSLMSKLAGGIIVKGITDVYPQEIKQNQIKLSTKHINRILGSNLSDKEIISKLTGLELKVDKDMVRIPTFRVDLKQPIDLVEEVARLVNYTNLPSRKFTKIPYESSKSILETQINFVRDEMISLGVQEAYTTSMIKEEEAALFIEDETIPILNPISDDMNTMRPSLFPGLLRSIAYNTNRHNKDLRLFEIGRVFQKSSDEKLPCQPYKLAMVLTGSRYNTSWNSPKDNVDFYDIKGYLEAFIGKLFLDNSNIILYDRIKYISDDQSVIMQISGKKVGECGQISSQVLKVFGITDAVYGFELNLDTIFSKMDMNRQFKPIPRFPFVERDLAFILDRAITSSEVVEFIQKTGSTLLKDVEIFDIYKGEKLGDDKISLAVRMRFQSQERTLNDKEVDEIFDRIIASVNKKFKSSLRE
jgi:phenylalanyl-tRNA synthetase beta chain